MGYTLYNGSTLTVTFEERKQTKRHNHCSQITAIRMEHGAWRGGGAGSVQRTPRVEETELRVQGDQGW